MIILTDGDKTFTLPTWDIELVRTFINWRDVPTLPRTFHIGFWYEFPIYVEVNDEEDLQLI